MIEVELGVRGGTDDSCGISVRNSYYKCDTVNIIKHTIQCKKLTNHDSSCVTVNTG